MRRFFAAALAAGALFVAPVWAADNYNVKDASGVTITIKSKDTGGGVQGPQSIPSDASGNPYTTASPLPTFVALGGVAVSTSLGFPINIAQVGGSTIAVGNSLWTQLAMAGSAVGAGNPLATTIISSALPSGAATAAKQPALGTAGVAATDVITVQGITSGVAVPISIGTLPAGTNMIGALGSTSVSGGIPSTARLAASAGSTNATNVKTTAGRVYSIQGYNAASYPIYLVLYDAATNPPLPGTTTIRKKIPLPPGAGFAFDWNVGLGLSNGIGFAFTKLAADADTTAILANDILALNIDYN